MYRSSWLLTAALVGTSVALVQSAVVALSATEVRVIAQAVTVEINLQEDSSVGSGVIIARQGDLYTLVTNRHVVCGKKSLDKVPTGESYDLGLADGQHYRVTAASVKLVGKDLDLAIVQFRSQRNYPVATIAPLNSLKATDEIYAAGFPPSQPGFHFNQGEAIAVVNQRLPEDRGGYTILYDAYTLPGMSGGGIFDRDGRLVAIHGQGEKYTKNTELEDKSRVGTKIGLNRGIPVRFLLVSLAAANIDLGSEFVRTNIKASPTEVPDSADRYFIAGLDRLVNPGRDVSAGKQLAIQEFTTAIARNPNYAIAYFMRGITYSQLGNFPMSLSDYDKAIAYNPKNLYAYNLRGVLKYEQMNDPQGALGDYDRAIAINPNFSYAYGNRALLKYYKLNDISGALTDYNRAIALNSTYSYAYYNRAILKYEKLNDPQGALTDFDRAIALNPILADAYYNRAILKYYTFKNATGAIEDIRQAAQLYRSQGQTQRLQDMFRALQLLGASE
jgi:tetratricopeptide (TPR) repeat protein